MHGLAAGGRTVGADCEVVLIFLFFLMVVPVIPGQISSALSAGILYNQFPTESTTWCRNVHLEATEPKVKVHT